MFPILWFSFNAERPPHTCILGLHPCSLRSSKKLQLTQRAKRN